MNIHEFLARWEKVKPQLVEIAEQFVNARELVTAGSSTVESNHHHRIDLHDAHGKAIIACSEHGLTILPGMPVAMYDDSVSDLVDFWFKATRYASTSVPELAADIVSTMPLVKINAPAWFRRSDFLLWLNSQNTATWHSKGSEPSDYSDVFFTFCQGDGSDSPGSTLRPGIPEDIWTQLTFMIVEQIGWDAEVLVWVSNLG